MSSINIPRLNKALNAVIAQHKLLHYGFMSMNSQLFTFMSEHINFKVSVFDQVEDQSMIDDLILKHTTQSFALDKPPLLRALVIVKSPQETILHFVIHHLICDGWSAERFLIDLMHYYHDDKITLEDNQVDYDNYINWLWRNIYPEVENKYLPFWRDRLHDYTFKPLFKENLAKDKTLPGIIKQVVKKRIVDGLFVISKRYGITLNSLLLTALYKTIAFFTKCNDVAAIIFFSGRESTPFGMVFGDLSNDVILRYKLSEQMLYSDIAKDIQNELINISTNQCLNPSMLRDRGLNIPMISYDFQKINQVDYQFDDNTVELISPSLPATLWGDNPRHLSFKLYLYKTDQLKFALKFRKDKYTEEQAHQIVEHCLQELMMIASVTDPVNMKVMPTTPNIARFKS